MTENTLAMYMYNVGFTHMERRKNGYWDESAQEILGEWIRRIYPILRDQGFNLVLSSSPFEPGHVDLKVMGKDPYLSTDVIGTVIKDARRPLSRFDVWLKSDFEKLGDMADLDATGAYKRMITSKQIVKVRVHSQRLVGYKQTIMIVGSVDTDSDEMIGFELKDRIGKVVPDTAVVPHFYVESTGVHTLDGKEFLIAKCAMALEEDAQQLQDLFTQLPTPASRTRYLITRDFYFVPLGSPGKRVDQALRTAMTRQQDFVKSITRTTIYGIKEDPYYFVPPYTLDAIQQTRVKNTQTVAQLIMLEPTTTTTTQGLNQSPVIKVSTNTSCSKIFLHGYTDEAQSLIDFTKRLLSTTEVWLEGLERKAHIDIIEAKKHILQTPLKHGGAYDSIGEEHEVVGCIVDKQAIAPSQQERKKGSMESYHKQTKDDPIGWGRPRPKITELIPSPAHVDDTYEGKIADGVHPRRGSTGPQLAGTGNKVTVEGNMEEHVGYKIMRDKIAAQDEKLESLRKLIVDRLPHTTEKDLVSLGTVTKTIETTLVSSLSATTYVHYQSYSEQMAEWNTKLLKQLEEISHRLDKLSNPQPGEDAVRTAPSPIILQHKTQTESPSTVHQEDAVQFVQGNREQADNDSGPDDLLADVRPAIMHTPSYHEKIREKAYGVLSLMESMPFTQGSSSSANDRDMSPTDRELQACAKCAKADHGLLYCDLCTAGGNLYHESCMNIHPARTEYLCDACNGKSQAEIEVPTAVEALTERHGGDNKPKEPHRDNSKVKDCWEDESTSSDSEESDYSPKYTAQLKAAKTLAHLSSQPKHLERQDTKCAPPLTRAAKKAAEMALSSAADSDSTEEEGQEE